MLCGAPLDAGWQLGEHNIWGKHTNFELGARVQIIRHARAHYVGKYQSCMF